jgi:hypothetical protein
MIHDVMCFVIWLVRDMSGAWPGYCVTWIYIWVYQWLTFLFVIQVCQSSAVGIRSSGGIPDHRLTASSEFNSVYAIIYGRLYSSSSWATKTTSDANDYLQIDLGAVHVLCALATQGSTLSTEWTKTYSISLSLDGVSWSTYQENNRDKVKVLCSKCIHYTQNCLIDNKTAVVRLFRQGFDSHFAKKSSLFMHKSEVIISCGLKWHKTNVRQLNVVSLLGICW